MAEYVYGRYDYVAEDDDEISFGVGKRIEVVEKDEKNGYWEVCSSSPLSISPIFLSFPWIRGSSAQRIPISCSRQLPCPSLTYPLLRLLLFTLYTLRGGHTSWSGLRADASMNPPPHHDLSIRKNLICGFDGKNNK